MAVSMRLYKALMHKNIYYVVYNENGILTSGAETDARKSAESVKKYLQEKFPNAKVETYKTSGDLSVLSKMVARIEKLVLKENTL